MKNLLLFILLLSGYISSAQYFYKDIIGTQETNMMMQNMVKAKVRAVNLKSFDAEGTIIPDLLVQQNVGRNPYSLVSITRVGDGDASVFRSEFDDKIRISKTIDSSGIVVNFSSYEYDAADKLLSIRSWTIDSTGATTSQEKHEWKYADGRVLNMTRSRNNVIIDEIRFIHDEAGNPIEEHTYKSGILTDKLFYYYNEKNQITDIVSRFNATVQMLMPDYMFEYSPSGQVIQKITIPPKGSDYMIWRYQYDANGIKTKEAVFNKYKEVQGRLEYIYSYY